MSKTLSASGADLNASVEGIYLYAYPDPGTGGDPWTIGIGHTRFSGAPAPRRGDRISFARAIQIFNTHKHKYEAGVIEAFGTDLPQNRFDAAFLFHFNTGAAVKGSVDDKYRRGDEAAALSTWGRYVHAGGKVMRGLEIRRAAEIRLWKTGDYGNRKIVVRDTPNSQGRQLAPGSIDWDYQEPTPELTADIPAPPLPERKPSGNFLIDIFNAITRQLR